MRQAPARLLAIAAAAALCITMPACRALREEGPHRGEREQEMSSHIRITLSSIFVNDQAKALRFYTETLGFEKKTDLEAGEYRFLTVASPSGPEGIELVLEPNAHPAARAFQEAIYADGIPATSFEVDDMEAEYRRLSQLGVAFRTPPTAAGTVKIALFDDTCGNLIQLHQSLE